MKKYISNEFIEFKAQQILSNYEKKFGELTLPIPIEKIVFQTFDLAIDYDEIFESGNIILGGICPRKKTIVLNIKHQNLFKEKPGLERFTIGHEAGHWEFDIDESTLDHPSLFINTENKYTISKSKKYGTISSFRGNIFNSLDKINTFRKFDSKDQARVVNRFSAALILPKNILRKKIDEFENIRWKDLYNLCEKFSVTITALTVRLEQLKLVFIRDKEIYRNIDEINGQLAIKF